jgi:hypothetical protein
MHFDNLLMDKLHVDSKPSPIPEQHKQQVITGAQIEARRTARREKDLEIASARDPMAI